MSSYKGSYYDGTLPEIELDHNGNIIQEPKNYNSVPVQELAEGILSGPTLDILYLFGERYAENINDNLYKAAIVQAFVDADQREGTKPTTYRATVDIAIAKLEGARFISKFQAGQKDMYYLTEYGKTACALLQDIYMKNPEIKRGTILINFD